MSIFSNSKSYFQNLTILSSSLILVTSVLTFSLPKISVSAATGSGSVIVTHKNGVNIRDKNCKAVAKAGYNQVLTYSGNANKPALHCTLSGEKFVMAAYGTGNNDMFVASKYIAMVLRNGETYTTQDKVSLNNPNGVNLRDGKCRRIMTLPNGTYSENFPNRGNIKYSLAPNTTCQVGSEFYMMTYFVYKGEIYQVAEALTRYE